MSNLIDKIPTKGLKGLKDHWKDDLLSGFMVSLIALPLCLGIAIASGVPPMAGLLAAIVGGLFMSRITGSFVTISGPAAGLIVVTLGAVETLGLGDPKLGYHYALAAIVIAGLIQVGFGLLKAGKLGDFFPSAAVHGMLAAIGVIIMVKQLFVALGTKAEGHELYEVIGEIPHAVMNMNPEVAFIALVSLFILIIHPYIKYKIIKIVPAPMWVLIVSIPLAHYFDIFHPHHYNLMGHDYELGPKYLVHLPNSIMDGIVFPDFGKFMEGAFWIAVVSITLVSSIESLLSATAVDTIDPYKRKSNLNRDLGAMGAGSAISGLLGGLPMISEIVRSSANISNGAKTQWANFFHGGFLLLFLLFGKPLIEQIPLAALAAMLIHVGFKLASPNEFKHVLEIGKAQFVVFVVTLVTVLATDLIIGIAVGIIVKIIIHLFYGVPFKNLFKILHQYEEKGDSGIIYLKKSAIFSNFLSLKSEIFKHDHKRHLIIDFTDVKLVDHTFRARLHDVKKEWEKEGKQFELVNKDHLIPVSNHPLATKLAAKEGADKTIELNDHQHDLLELAAQINWNFDGKQSLHIKDYEDFILSKSGQLVLVQNQMHSVENNINYKFAEIVVDMDVTTRAADTLIPALLLTPTTSGLHLPVFTLEKEVFFDKIMEWSGFDDIDFDNHPEFSKKFLLKGVKEDNVREFFNESLIKMIEDEPNYHIESNGKSMIIYRFDHDNHRRRIKELIEFGKKITIVEN